MKSVAEIGVYKKENNMTILQPNRWGDILNSRVEKGAKFDLSEKLIESVFKSIHQESINNQEIILRS